MNDYAGHTAEALRALCAGAPDTIQGRAVYGALFIDDECEAFYRASFEALPAALDRVAALEAALREIASFTESPDWGHDTWSDDAGWHIDCEGRAMVRAMAEDALGE